MVWLAGGRAGPGRRVAAPWPVWRGWPWCKPPRWCTITRQIGRWRAQAAARLRGGPGHNATGAAPLLPVTPPAAAAPTPAPAASSSGANTAVAGNGQPLRLDNALALLRQAGQAQPAGVAGSPAYLQALIDQLVDLSSRDPLTGLANRRSFELALTREVDRVARSGESALLLMVDIDHFKRVNDHHGHAAGDQVIRAVAQALTDSVRPMDLTARIGGEEFAVLLPNCPAAFGPQVAARVRQRVAGAAVSLPLDGQQVSVTVSVGGAFAPQWVRSSAAIWLQRADSQLYRAKAEGRDRVCLEQSATLDVSAQERELLLGGPPIRESE